MPALMYVLHKHLHTQYNKPINKPLYTNENKFAYSFLLGKLRLTQQTDRSFLQLLLREDRDPLSPHSITGGCLS